MHRVDLATAFLALALGASTIARADPLPPAPGGARPLHLPGGDPRIDMDYLAVDRADGRLWVPAGGTGQVDVIDIESGAIHTVTDFATVERDRHGQLRLVGPSSATVGAGFVYVGSRADSTVCAIDAQSLTKGGCVILPTAPDGLCFVSTTQEVWVTTPGSSSVTILDVHQPGTPTIAGSIPLGGKPEGYAFDSSRGVFFTNFEDKDTTVSIDVKTRRPLVQWPSGCGEAGPRGLAIDEAEQILFVACTDRVLSEDLAANGKPINQLPTGGGVDNIDYLPSQHRLYVTAGKAARLTTARSAHGVMTLESTRDSAIGGRVVVVDGDGRAFVADSSQGRILMYASPP